MASAPTLNNIDTKAVELFEAEVTKPARWTWQKQFPVVGKGTFLFNIARSTPFFIIVRGQTVGRENESWIGLTVSLGRVSFLDKIQDQDPQLLCEATSSGLFGTNVGIEPGYTCTYWLSYDRDRMVIKYGKGYRMEKTTILEYDYGNLEAKKQKEIRNQLFDPKVDRYVEVYDDYSSNANNGGDGSGDGVKPFTAIADVQKEVDFSPVPLVTDLPYIVKHSSTVNLFDLDSGEYMYSKSLPEVCQDLFTNITGENVDLDYQGTDPQNQYPFKLSDAIRYSIDTKGCKLYEKLQFKANEFGHSDPQTTYLRITLGQEHGNSPGIPYVLEIWPKGHGSPVHNHGNAYAVIRVLHGRLTIHYYNKASESINPEDQDLKNKSTGPLELGVFNVRKGDITWIHPNWYQTHKLWNATADYCATIQCYQYGDNDYLNWPYFDYMKSCDIIGEFTPTSDYSFTDMYNLVMQEYANRPQTE